jgi:hypothetical protein
MRGPQEIRLQIVRFLVPSFWKDDHPRHVPFAAAIFFREGKCLSITDTPASEAFPEFFTKYPDIDALELIGGKIAA